MINIRELKFKNTEVDQQNKREKQSLHFARVINVRGLIVMQIA